MRRPASIVSSKPRFEILSHTDVALILGCEALKEIHVLHEFAPLRECAELRFGGQPSLRSWLACQPKPLMDGGLPTEALAKVGGGQAIQPSLGSLLRFEIHGLVEAA